MIATLILTATLTATPTAIPGGKGGDIVFTLQTGRGTLDSMGINRAPHGNYRINVGPTTVIRIEADGTLWVHPRWSKDKAAKEFWKAVGLAFMCPIECSHHWEDSGAESVGPDCKATGRRFQYCHKCKFYRVSP